jgi:hypothetical protein
MAYRFALITGATGGIGAAFARALPPETHLLLTGRNQERLEALSARLAHPGRRVEAVVADLAREDGRAAVVAQARTSEIDLLINNAGLGRLGRLIDNPEASEREMVEVNVVAVLVLTRALLPDMVKRARMSGRRAGLIVTASAAGFSPLPFLATYAATKAFDLHLAEALAAEFADDPVDVLALCPGTTDTDFFARAHMAGSAMPTMDSPARVAREALAALGRRHVHVVGPTARFTTWIGRIMPRRLALAAAAAYMAKLKKRSGV